MAKAKKREKQSVSCLMRIVTFLFFAFALCLAFVLLIQQHNRGVDISSSSVVGSFDQGLLKKQYHDILLRSESLQALFKNITGKSPPMQSEFVDSIGSKVNSLINGADIDRNSVMAIVNTDININMSRNKNEKTYIDIVIGMAQDTDPKNLVTFCSSFRKYSTAAESNVVLFVNTPVQKRNLDIAKKYDVELIEFNLNNLSILGKNYEYFEKYHPSSLRWGFILNYFNDVNVRQKYKKVLLIDVRDSFFQSDPFLIIPTNTVSAFYGFKGVESISISQCGWNSGWIKDCFSQNVLKDIGHNNIICSGVSIGTMDIIYQYLILMDDILMARKVTDISKLSTFPLNERNGVDQGVHNVLIYKGLIPHLTIFSNMDGKVINMQGKTAIVDGKIVTNDKGEKYPIVHQYDRYPNLQKELFSEYVDWVDTNNPEAEWESETSCTKYGHKNNVDLFQGRCDLKMQGGATSAASCCVHCQNNLKCKAFTYLSGTCYMKSCNNMYHQNEPMQGAVSGFSIR